MRSGQKTFGSLFILLCIVTSSLFGSDDTIQPVTPNASPEAKALLEFMVRISGKYTLTGQHNFPNTKDRNSQFAAKYIGKTPAVWSTDWGFAEEGDTDSYLARPDIVEEARRQHELGSVITICWHAVPPTADEPVTFRPRPNAPPGALASVQGQLLDQQFKDVLTPGTELNKKWCAQVDAVAFHLKKLQEARVPILWRPYHEMNGDWFWWGGRLGQYSTKALYRQIFDRLVHHHKLTNLVWVWSVDRPNKPEMQFSNYYPGDDYLDILSLDVYRSDFNQSYYDDLLALSNGKPLVLGEVGNPPTLEILGHQPKWGLYVIWAGMVRNTLKKQHRVLVHDPRILSLEDPAYWKAIAPFRAACKLPPLPLKGKKIDLSGTWIFNEDDSVLDNWGLGGAPYKLELAQKENELAIRRSFIVEWGDDRIMEEKLSLDGTEHKSTFWNSPRITTARWSEDGDMLIVESKVTFTRGDRTNEMVTKEVWSLLKQGDVLSMAQTSTSFRGERKITMMFDKR